MRKKQMLKVLLTLICFVVAALNSGGSHAQADPVNLALGQDVTFSHAPNYSYCTDANDATQLTDGVLGNATPNLWLQQGTVGWSYVDPVTITVDLGSVQPISGVAFSTAAGYAGVVWPTRIYIGVSDDNYSWHYAGDLVNMADDSPPQNGYAQFVYQTTQMQTKGRYVSFTITGPHYIFSDEIGVFEGDSSWVNYTPAGSSFPSISSMIQFAEGNPGWEPPYNIALGRSVSFSAAPNYALCTDSYDAAQITDGYYSTGSGQMWSKTSTVGWQYIDPVVITIDLGSEQPISGLSFSTAGGSSNVRFPSMLLVGVSDDGTNWHYIGDLTTLTGSNPPPTNSGYSTFVYGGMGLQTKGRYVSITVVASPYIFTDEIQVYRGNDSWLNNPAGGTAYSSMQNLINGETSWEPQPHNIALGKPATFSAAPNYALCTDANDAAQITDGNYTAGSGQMWSQTSTVGWSHVNPVVITIDLGRVQPIAGASFSTGGGSSGVNWPSMLFVAVSEDGVNWNYAGDLTALTDTSPPPMGSYSAFRYKTMGLKTKGRYVAIGVENSPYTFTDEIEIYRGDYTWLSSVAGGTAYTSLANLIDGETSWESDVENIALGKSVTFNVPPNYALCTDANDPQQVTDGSYTTGSGSIWTHTSTVGWSNKNPVIITIDLGSVQPIAGMSYSTAGGYAGVSWPSSLSIGVSDDGQTWHYAGDLTRLADSSPPPMGSYSTFIYSTLKLRTKGRYIAISIDASNFVFTDEIEVYRGSDVWLNNPVPGAIFTSMDDLFDQERVGGLVKSRLNDNLDSVQGLLDSSSLSSEAKESLQERLDQDAFDIGNMGAAPTSTQSILPLNATDQDIFAVRGEILNAQGFGALTLWKQHRYAWQTLFQTPSTQQTVELDYSMLKNQKRSDAILLTNASGSPMTVSMQLQNPPSGATSGWFTMYYAEWTDTAQGVPVADALLQIPLQSGSYTTTIPAGVTRKIWVTVDSSKVPSGAYTGSLKVSYSGGQPTVPLHLAVSTIAMNTPRFSLGMFDYSNGTGNRGITTTNRAEAITLMKSHYVDTPWATSAVLPTAAASYFDSNGNLTHSLNFTNLDQWIALWPGARNYFVFASVSGSSFAGATIGTTTFNQRVGSWAKALSQHMTSLGLQPQMLGLLLRDEPDSDAEDNIISAWATAINSKAPELTLYEDPVRDRPDLATNQSAITSVDILCPVVHAFLDGGSAAQNYFENLRANGHKLWLYQCVGPVRLFDPQSYYRNQAWLAFAHKATGENFWSFGDTGGVSSSWNEYMSAKNYAPAFLDPQHAYDSVHWESVAEGVEDYEELSMLHDAINATSNQTLKNQAQAVLDTAVSSITDNWPSNYDYTWSDQNPSANATADTQLQNVRDMLETLN